MPSKNAKKSRRSKRVVAVVALLLVVVVTVVAASLTAGVHPIASALASVFGTGHKKGESCASPWCGLRVGME